MQEEKWYSGQLKTELDKVSSELEKLEEVHILRNKINKTKTFIGSILELKFSAFGHIQKYSIYIRVSQKISQILRKLFQPFF